MVFSVVDELDDIGDLVFFFLDSCRALGDFDFDQSQTWFPFHSCRFVQSVVCAQSSDEFDKMIFSCFCANKFRYLSVFFILSAFSCGNSVNSYTDYEYFPLNYRKPNSLSFDRTANSLSNHKIDSKNGNVCGRIFRDRQIVIHSVNYPELYPNNLHCVYTFASPFVCTSEYHVQFLDFAVESSPNCTKDRLRIGRHEILCGKVIGIMKYRANNGILRIDFSTDEFGQDKGFRLLITRLPCTNSDENSRGFVTSLPVATIDSPVEIFQSVELTTPSIPSSSPSPPTNVIWNGVIPSHEFQLPDGNALNFQQPTPYEFPFAMQPRPSFTAAPWSPSNGYLPPSDNVHQIVNQNLPNCCINSFHQRRLYLVSANFPYSGSQRSDCVYHLHRNNPNVCRLRVILKYFLVGQSNDSQTNCGSNFLEVDEQRICGCKTGMTFIFPWTNGDKIVRYSNLYEFNGTQGFALDIIQEECPFGVTQDASVVIEQSTRLSIPINDSNNCQLNYGEWFRIAMNQLFLSKPLCIKNNF